MLTAAKIYVYLAYDGRTDILTIKAYGAGVEANETGPLTGWTRAGIGPAANRRLAARWRGQG